ncbi:EcsC family protein [Nocardioides sp. Kera G14]|uniref:EcsC family protein n=1 Tax=Nocardioides sp. Kera G14 TaxID=2884264 RepID=UPI001D0F852B|nr:EcsC family protein [Nocardioides sp. Kera G14]UDY23362.1 EcsC family protein [Nocardioides sp. Kera G14]
MTKKAAAAVGTSLAPKIIQLAPDATSSLIGHTLNRAILGVGPLPGAAAAGDTALRKHGTVDKAINALIRKHVAYATTEGFATNLGGLITAVATIPANVVGLAVIECRMIASIAHLRGYDLDDPRVRDAMLLIMLGESTVDSKVAKKKLPATPMAVATAPVHDPTLDHIVASEVAAEMLTRVAGKRLASTIGKRTPIIGGFVGAGVDGWDTYQIGRYARRELLPRTSR